MRRARVASARKRYVCLATTRPAKRRNFARNRRVRRKDARGTRLATRDCIMSSIAPKPPVRTVILTAIDATAASQDAVSAAARFGLLPGSELHFVHVISALGKPDDAAIDKGRALLEGTAQALGLVDKATLHLTSGKPWREIVQLAAHLLADLVIVGTLGRSGV